MADAGAGGTEGHCLCQGVLQASGFITREWYPHFYAVHRNGETFEEAYGHGDISQTAKRIYDIVREGYVALHEIKALGSFGKEEKFQFDRAMIVFDEQLPIDLGGITCELIHAAGDSVICYVPSERFVFLGDSNGKNLYWQPWHYDPKTFDEEMARIPWDWDRVDAYLQLLDGLDFTRCLGGHADDMSREELYSAYKR